MRKIIVAGLTAAVLGLGASTGASAAPVNGTVIGDQAAATDNVNQVQWHWRWGSHWRWRSSGGHWRWGSRGYHWRWRSLGY